MLQHQGKSVVLLHIPLVTEEQFLAAEAEIQRLQQRYRFGDVPYHMVRNDYEKVLGRKIFIDPKWKYHTPTSTPSALPLCRISFEEAIRHLKHARSVLRLFHFTQPDIRRLYRAFELRFTWKWTCIDANQMAKRFPPTWQ